MNFEPPQPFLSDFFAFAEQKKSSHKVVSDVIEVGRDGVDSSSEVEVMGEVEIIYFRKCSCNIEFEVEISSE